MPRSCYYAFSVLTAFQKRAAPGLRVPEYSEGGGGVFRLKFAFDGLDPGRCWPGSDLVGCIESPATS